MEIYLVPSRPKLGNGSVISFWHDCWTPLGPLFHRFGDLGPKGTSNPKHSNRAGWIFRGARSEAAEELLIYLTYLQLPSLSTIEDTYVWVVDNEELTDFSSRKTWNLLRNRGQTQLWTKNIWFKSHVPKHAFTAWIAHQDRLSRWGMNVSPLCCLCSSTDETRYHLLLRCEISESIWDLVLGCHFQAFHTWTAFSEWLSIRDAVTSRTLKRLAAQATISSIWNERNKRLHDGEARTPAAIFNTIDRFIRDTILGKRKLKAFTPLMQLWLPNG
ncbi:hypothetical protein Bca4012_095366 [Brassica carinata]